mmetsp:Transcript_18852/g.21064  ORF Transcript_18852/g.21064 Transcript_18852/m.21064 type:complete len:280 (+) Transcript_18852:247-1086(+)
MRELNIPKTPFVALLYYDENQQVQNLGSLTGEEIHVENFFNILVPAMDILHSSFEGGNVPDFNIPDSNLEAVETEEFKEIMRNRLENRNITGFIEPRERRPQIDPSTGMPVGMTPQLIQDRILKDEIAEERKMTDVKNKHLIDQMKIKEEEKKEKQKVELEEQAKIEKLTEERNEMAEAVKANLPDEPEKGEGIGEIVFRLPSGNSISRRFQRDDKIQLLYDYITSLGEDNGFENAHTHFGIQQSLPFKSFDNLSATIEEEGLYPRSRVIVREHSHVDS